MVASWRGRDPCKACDPANPISDFSNPGVDGMVTGRFHAQARRIEGFLDQYRDAMEGTEICAQHFPRNRGSWLIETQVEGFDERISSNGLFIPWPQIMSAV